ncbi:MAG TPA: flagellar biosynthesis protein FlgN [Bradyrhizobium sp.]|jgi:hypothetical protein|nr:flagellar biosynthesis protein FlgN [Bradyrhizobium sp.]
MQVDDGGNAMVAESLNVETEGLDGATLPVHVPVGSNAATSTEANGARPDEVRGLLAAIRRLEDVVGEETIALETRAKVDFDDFSARKSQSMLEFVRLMRARIHLGGEPQITEEIQRLREKLERNRAILEMHYAAVRDVASIIVKAIREAESDGTYSARATWNSK